MFSDFAVRYHGTNESSVASSPLNNFTDFYKFQLVPDKDYLNRIQTTHKKFARIYPLYDADIKYEVRGYTFPFILFAPHAVRLSLSMSMGWANSHTKLWYVDMSHQDSIRRNR